MKKKPNALHKFFSLSRWQRKFGATRLNLFDYEDEDFEHLKINIIDIGDPVLSRGSAKDIQQHYAALKQEFSGQPELCFHHAMLIVMIRREIDVSHTFARFRTLWEQHEDWLLEHVNIRWLVSACDTFADYSQDATERSLAMATTLLVNTVKAYETENVMTSHTQIQYEPERVAHVQQHSIPLFEGLSCYTIGTDDTLRNMVWRIKETCPTSTTGRILMEVFKRLSTLPTAFGRMRQAHTRTKTQFWD